METTLERELREWRASRDRETEAMAAAGAKLFANSASSSSSAWQGPRSRRVRVKGQETIVVAKPKRLLPS